MSAKDLMRLHVEALFTRDGAGRLLAVNEPGGAPAPRFFLGRTTDGDAWWFRHDVSEALAHDLSELCRSQPADFTFEGLAGAEPFTTRISREEPVRRTWAGPAYCFPSDLPDAENTVHVTAHNAELLSPFLDAWRGDVAAGVPMYVALDDGKAVAVCASVRLTPYAHEAGVETHRDFRRRGHAARAVLAWARAVREMNVAPLYSTSWENEPSRALARTLGLIQFGVDLHVT